MIYVYIRYERHAMPWSDGYDGTEAARGSHAQSHLSEICGATTASLQRQEIWHPTMGSSEASWCSWLFLKMLMIHWRIWIGVDSWQHDMFSFQRNDQHRCREAIGNCFSIHRNQGLFSRWKCSSLVNASCHNLLWGQLSHVVFKWGMIHQTDHGICGIWGLQTMFDWFCDRCDMMQTYRFRAVPAVPAACHLYILRNIAKPCK